MVLTEMIKVGEQLLQQALEAVGRYQEAIDSSAPEVELERLRIEAESLLQTIREYRVRVRGSSES
jgi:hypothetical protein